MNTQAVDQLILQSKLKEKSLNTKKNKLSNNKEMLEVETTFDNRTKKKMLRVLTAELKELERESFIIKHILNNIQLGQQNNLSHKSYLLSLPYLLLVDFNKKEVRIVFHDQITVGEKVL